MTRDPLSVHLRRVIDNDLPIFFEHQRDPVAVHMAAFTVKDPSDRAAFDTHWGRILADDSTLIRTIVVDGQVAGSVFSYGPPGEIEVSYWLGREFWGRGIATAALAEFLKLQNTRPIYARAAKDNGGSLRVLVKCGFVVIGNDKGFANARGQEIEEYLLELAPDSQGKTG